MIRFVVFCILFAIAAKVSPVESEVVTNFAKKARDLVHQSYWALVGTISTNESNKGYPFLTLLPIADSKVNEESTGDIFFYMMEDNLTAINVDNDSRTSFTFTDRNCHKKAVDPESRECYKAIVSGKVRKLVPDDEEYDFGKEAFLSRHPNAADWISSKNSVKDDLRMVDVTNVMILSGPGEYQHVSTEDYFAYGVVVEYIYEV